MSLHPTLAVLLLSPTVGIFQLTLQIALTMTEAHNEGQLTTGGTKPYGSPFGLRASWFSWPLMPPMLLVIWGELLLPSVELTKREGL